ncbi:hypothetical protein [Escherichia coli]|uniref:hypothetical protein n=1 Tax=Escherichia coli TaxID=562 RepID=UPI00207CDEF8|nr:hypothetical protein [Escherichia coli]
MLALQPRYSNYTLSSGILRKTKEVGVKRWFLIITVFAIIYAIFPALKAPMQIISLAIIAIGAFITVSVLVFKVLKFLVWLSKDDGCKVHQEKEGKITKVD